MSRPSLLQSLPIVFLICLLFGLPAWSMPAARAADGPTVARSGWESAAASDDIVVWVQDGAGMTAEDFAVAYGDKLATALDELLLFLHVPAVVQPIEIDVYRDIDAYRSAIEGFGRLEIPNQIAVAEPETARIALPVDSFGSLTPLDAENQLRHALAHVVTGWATDFTISRGFDEGIAQYVKRPNLPVQARLAALVQAAQQNGTLASWASLNRDGPSDDDDMERAQSYAMVAYVIRHQGLPALWTFLEAAKTAGSWRSALDAAVSPATSDQIERQWREAIPSWAAGEWRWNLMTGFDLEPARTQLARGNFAGATAALEISEQLLRDIDDPGRAAAVAELQNQARIGELAETKMTEAQKALDQFLYDRAAAAVAQANDQYALLPPEIRPDELIETYAAMAAQGIAATNDLDIAHAQSGRWNDYANTRALAQSAGEDFAALGDTARRDDADRLVRSIDQGQLRIVLLLAALAVLAFGWLALWTKTRGSSPLKWE